MTTPQEPPWLTEAEYTAMLPFRAQKIAAELDQEDPK